MPAPRMVMTMTAEPGAGPALYRLLAWLSPSFPIGAFSYSHGIEAAVAAGAVCDRSSLEGWIAAIVAAGSGRIDVDILCEAYRAAAAADLRALDAANQRGLAFRATAELALEAAQQGGAFLDTCRAAWPEPFIEAWAGRARSNNKEPSPPTGARGKGEGGSHGARQFPLTPTLSPNGGEGEIKAGEEGVAEPTLVCHSAVFGAVAARAGIALADALLGYLEAFAANLVSAGLRLGIIGQTDGQRILAALEPVVGDAASAASTREAADFGAATFAVDLASMTHETQYSRLFRS
jgi:urease accessory protein